MARRSDARTLRDDELLLQLEESDIDLSDADENEDTAFTPRPEEDEESSTSSSSSSDEEIASQSDVSLQSSIVERRSRGRSRTRPTGRRGGTRGTRGHSRQASIAVRTPISDAWNGQFEPLELLFYQPSYKKVETESWVPEDYFTQYINDDILEEMTTATNRTNILRKGHTLGLTVKELKVFFGITMVMSAINLPKIALFWSQKYGVQVIKKAMTRNRYFNIRNSLKVIFDSEVSDEEKLKTKIWKVNPLFQSVLRGCHAQEKPIELSIDEMIVPFSGQCGIRQYCPGKPNPVGLKIFVLATPQGIVLDMLPYQGDTTCPKLIEEGYTLGEASILSLCKTLVRGHHIYFDRYFTTVKLAEILLQKGFHATGTIQKNRIPKNCQLSDEKAFAKKPRGYSETKSRCDKVLNIVRWLDNKPVILLSTIHSSENQIRCRRWSKKNKIYEFVSRPEIVKSYNQYMGGVDMADRMLSVCPSRSRTKKWTVRFISHMVDLAVSNAWILYKEREAEKGVNKYKIPQLRTFKLDLGTSLIEKNSLLSDSESLDETEELQPKHKKRKVSIIPIPSEIVRHHKAEHLVDYSGTQKRCRNPKCSKTTTAFCTKCNIFLCSTPKRNCHLRFHKK